MLLREAAPVPLDCFGALPPLPARAPRSGPLLAE
jgi:hypothetical protein